VALLVTIPVFLGACTQLLAPGLIRRWGRRKAVFVAASALQALAWLVIVAAFLVPRSWGYGVLLAGFVLSFAGLHAGVPAWTSVMGDLVPSDVRGRFFGSRNSACFLIQVAAMVIAGIALQVFRSHDHERLGFIVLFSGAFAARVLSVLWLTRMHEPEYAEKEDDVFSLWQFLRRLPESNFARFAVFVGLFNASAHVAGCLFIPYWRRSLGFSYAEYMVVVSAIMLGQVVGLPFWGRLADRFGNRRTLLAASVYIAAVPALWMSTTTVWGSVLLQLGSGFFWSGFNQSVANFLLDAVSPGKRARCTAYLNVITNTGLLLGGLAGSWAITRVPVEFGPVTLPYAFWTLLIVSFVLRSGTVVLMMARFREVRPVPEAGPRQMFEFAARGVLGRARD
jgi:MFS family permease